jgi:hypothetical protein
LKSCIADLKKLATSKVKKTSAALGGAVSNSNQNSQSNLYKNAFNQGPYERFENKYGAP